MVKEIRNAKNPILGNIRTDVIVQTGGFPVYGSYIC